MSQLGSGQETLWITEAQSHSGQKIVFKSRNVIMATGAEQIVGHSNFKQKYGMKESAKVFDSD